MLRFGAECATLTTQPATARTPTATAQTDEHHRQRRTPAERDPRLRRRRRCRSRRLMDRGRPTVAPVACCKASIGRRRASQCSSLALSARRFGSSRLGKIAHQRCNGTADLRNRRACLRSTRWDDPASALEPPARGCAPSWRDRFGIEVCQSRRGGRSRPRSAYYRAHLDEGRDPRQPARRCADAARRCCGRRCRRAWRLGRIDPQR